MAVRISIIFGLLLVLQSRGLRVPSGRVRRLLVLLLKLVERIGFSRRMDGVFRRYIGGLSEHSSLDSCLIDDF